MNMKYEYRLSNFLLLVDHFWTVFVEIVTSKDKMLDAKKIKGLVYSVNSQASQFSCQTTHIPNYGKYKKGLRVLTTLKTKPEFKNGTQCYIVPVC